MQWPMQSKSHISSTVKIFAIIVSAPNIFGGFYQDLRSI